MKFALKTAIIAILLAVMLLPAGCTALLAEDDRYIISASEALRLLGEDGVVLVYAAREPHMHVKGALIITRDDIVIDYPVPGMLLPQDQFEQLMERTGISNDDLVIIYDSRDSREAARLWWTLKVYGHTNAIVVSGGLDALLEVGAETTAEPTRVTPTNYTAQPANQALIATVDEVLTQVTRPDENVIIIDTRPQEIFDAGHIPGAVLVSHVDNLHPDTTPKSIQLIKLMYRGKGIREDNVIILYCHSGVTAAVNFLALSNAGYRNLKLFDGSWLEWTATALPVELPVAEEDIPAIPEPPRG